MNLRKQKRGLAAIWSAATGRRFRIFRGGQPKSKSWDQSQHSKARPAAFSFLEDQ